MRISIVKSCLAGSTRCCGTGEALSNLRVVERPVVDSPVPLCTLPIKGLSRNLSRTHFQAGGAASLRNSWRHCQVFKRRTLAFDDKRKAGRQGRRLKLSTTVVLRHGRQKKRAAQ